MKKEPAPSPFMPYSIALNRPASALTILTTSLIGFSYEPFRSMYEESESDFTRRQFAEVYSREAQLQYLDRRLPEADWSRKPYKCRITSATPASAFYATDFEESLILVVDGMGELDRTTSPWGTKPASRSPREFGRFILWESYTACSRSIWVFT